MLRLGRFRALRGPGLFGIIPIIDTIPYWIDTRVITSSFKAEKTLTRIAGVTAMASELAKHPVSH